MEVVLETDLSSAHVEQPCCLGGCTPAAPDVLCFTELSSCSVQASVRSLLAGWRGVTSLSVTAVISRAVVYVSVCMLCVYPLLKKMEIALIGSQLCHSDPAWKLFKFLNRSGL